MSKLLLNYDPLTGISESLHFTAESEAMHIVREQDVSNILSFTQAAARDDDYTKEGVKRGQWHYARIPNEVEAEMWTKHGVKWEDKNDKEHKKFFSVLNRHYGAFKTTAWNHE